MLDNISPGDRVQIKVVRQPSRVSAVKTLLRVLSKDQRIAAEHKRLRQVRDTHYNPQRRGGRLYGGQMIKLQPIKAQPGDSGTVLATVDVINDLRSVERFIEVTPA